MKQFISILKKEIFDNLRDRRALFFALLYGPVLMPLLMFGPLSIGMNKKSSGLEKPIVAHMDGVDRVDNLVQFLREENIHVKALDKAMDFRQAVAAEALHLVIEKPENYEKRLRMGDTLNFNLVYNDNNNKSTKAFRAVRAALTKYGRQLTAMRMQARGIDTRLLRAVHITNDDLSGTRPSDKIVSLLLPFIMMLSLTMGGFYLAIDITAGERERHSLEPLLALSVSRLTLVMGKLFALVCFVGLSSLLAALSTYLLCVFMPVKEFVRFIDVNFVVFVKVFLICTPLILFFSSAMMLIATFAKNTKEAQTHLSIAMLLPTLPFFVLQFINPQDTDTLLWLPVMSQFILIDNVVTGQTLEYFGLFQSVFFSLGFGALFLLQIVRLYRRESILEG